MFSIKDEIVEIQRIKIFQNNEYRPYELGKQNRYFNFSVKIEKTIIEFKFLRSCNKKEFKNIIVVGQD